MPAIRDWTINSNITAGTTIGAFLPQYSTGDLLLALCSSANNQSFTSAGWNRLFTANTVTGFGNLSALWKIAGAVETDPTFTYSSSNTAGVHLISIQDVNTVSPFNATSNTASIGYAIANTSTSKGNAPFVFTQNNNSLILVSQMTTVPLIPTILEGPVIYEDGADYVAHSEGFSWGFQKTAGGTANNIIFENMATANISGLGIVATIAISPPTTGANVIPSYCASDASVLIDPVSGTSAFNRSTGFSNNVTTTFGTILNGKSMANSTANIASSSAQDVGINSYHSLAQIAGNTTSGIWFGGMLMPSANTYNFTGKNILLHAKPSTPKVLQTTDGIGRTGTKGIAFGMASTVNANTNYKIWHTHGQGTSWDNAQHLPMVINSNNTSGLISSNGTFSGTPLAYGVWCSGETVAPVWQFGSMWALDTTTICGGNAANPTNTRSIVKAASSGKERFSILQQGIAQALIMQPIQFGNGGTDALYLNLDSSAIEFPKQYDISKKQVFYCSVNNVAGLSYYAGPGDTVIHSNATIISQDKYFWGFNANTSSLATYNFNGTVINGAGNVTLSANVPLNTVTFGSCDQINTANANLTGCVFSTTTAGAGQGAVSISGNTQQVLQNQLNNLINCQFINNTSSNGALRISYTGNSAPINLYSSTLTFSGNFADIYWDAPVGSTLTFKQYGLSNALLTNSSNNNTVVIQNVKTFGQINFNTYDIQDKANCVYRLFYNQINQANVSSAFGTSKAILVKALTTDLSGDGTLEVKGTLVGPPTSATFDYDYTYNNQASWTANTVYQVGDEYSNRVGINTTWYRTTNVYKSSSTFGSTDTANSTVITGPTVVFVCIGRTNSDYFNVNAILVPNVTTVISAINAQELNYSS